MKKTEICMEGLKRKIGDDDFMKVCLDALNKGPKRVRIASREELKIEIQKYKNAYLNLAAAWKKTG
jgi:hypothetical protein